MNINIENTNLAENSHSPIIIRSNNMTSSNFKNPWPGHEENLLKPDCLPAWALCCLILFGLKSTLSKPMNFVSVLQARTIMI